VSHINALKAYVARDEEIVKVTMVLEEDDLVSSDPVEVTNDKLCLEERHLTEQQCRDRDHWREGLLIQLCSPSIRETPHPLSRDFTLLQQLSRQGWRRKSNGFLINGILFPLRVCGHHLS